MISEALREQLERRNIERIENDEPRFYILVNQAQAMELMAGRLPEEISDMARTMIEWSLQTGPIDYVSRRERQQFRERTTRKKMR